MEITYKKVNHYDLFLNFKDENLLNMENCFNYIPIYNRYFNLNQNNYNNISLNNQNSLKMITNKISENIFDGEIIKENGDSQKQKIFFKLSPLLDPFRYLAGKYNSEIEDINILPKFDSNCHPKLLDPNNTSYVDSFFTYLTSQLLNKNDFIHGLDFYGSYIGIKNNYHVDIGDDLEMLRDSKHFHENQGFIYNFINTEHNELFNDSRTNKKPLDIGDDNADITFINLEELSINEENNTSVELTYQDENLLNNKSCKSSKNSSSVSSRSSNTDNNNDNESNSESYDSDSEESSSNSSEYSDECVMVSINKFPIQIISLECCDGTFDSLLEQDKIKDEELSCIVIQILMMLITYQKVFNLTHNDLHTNNIMYINTDKKYLYYKLNERHYKVKTFGKIFKIIDFGRAIYKFREQTLISDAFYKNGDAATQYNFGEIYNENKPIVEPNMSFDLCRLGCSIYDFIMAKYEKEKDASKIEKIIMNWCIDDDNRNILYKNNDEERYPDFKLYKMIARKVHNHIPSQEIKNSYFDKWIVPKKEIKKGSKIMNIDLF